MQLTAEQQEIARRWVADGMKLSEFQKRLEADFGLRLTYMEVRLLVDDLKVLPKDPEPPKAAEPAAGTGAVTPPNPPQPPAGGVQVTVDVVNRPGTLVSGRVTFSDGQGGAWYVDQYGRPGLAPDTKGYRPSPTDLQEFQVALDRELVKLGI